jgi:hypothetical protein
MSALVMPSRTRILPPTLAPLQRHLPSPVPWHLPTSPTVPQHTAHALARAPHLGQQGKGGVVHQTCHIKLGGFCTKPADGGQLDRVPGGIITLVEFAANYSRQSPVETKTGNSLDTLPVSSKPTLTLPLLSTTSRPNKNPSISTFRTAYPPPFFSPKIMKSIKSKKPQQTQERKRKIITS